VLNEQGDIKATLKRTGIPLGMKADTQFESTPEIVLSAGDLILLLTDGIEEASAPDGTLFGLARILDTVRSNRSRPAQQIVQALYETVRAFASNAPKLTTLPPL